MIVELKGIIFPKSNKVANRRSEPSELSPGGGSLMCDSRGALAELQSQQILSDVHGNTSVLF